MDNFVTRTLKIILIFFSKFWQEFNFVDSSFAGSRFCYSDGPTAVKKDHVFTRAEIFAI